MTRQSDMGSFPAALCFFLVVVKLRAASAESQFGAEQNVQGDYFSPPRSNVVMQSVVLGRRRPGPEHTSCDADDETGLRQLLKKMLSARGRRYLPYRKTELDAQDSEVVDSSSLERMMSAVRKARKRTKPAPREESEEEVEVERLVEMAKDKERRQGRMRELRNRRRRKLEEEAENYWGKRKGEDVEEERGRRWNHRRKHRTKEWDKRGFEEEWYPHKKKPQESRDVLYLPPQMRTVPRQTSSEEYASK